MFLKTCLFIIIDNIKKIKILILQIGK